MGNSRVRVTTPLAWAILVILALIIIDVVFPFLLTLAISVALVWAALYLIASVCWLLNID